eukprot:CAMPEP_0172169096 /NCGR_PEP_ID=MMETSP1050-20130122/10512_1 /TAXON_ID=233186 /ORGANISM="Cryptomonas curvata, Strain CCAP979/52" /LENGTH=251 /DNA_ID=CAMNT_0012840109 /DNA_START=125 /DNA_END=877 /DNA_ORIENTATION=-
MTQFSLFTIMCGEAWTFLPDVRTCPVLLGYMSNPTCRSLKLRAVTVIKSSIPATKLSHRGMITCHRRQYLGTAVSTSLNAISSRISGAEDEQRHPVQSSQPDSSEPSLEDYESRRSLDISTDQNRRTVDNDLQENSEFSDSIFGMQGEKTSMPTARRWSQVMSVSPEFMALAQAQFEALASTMDAERCVLYFRREDPTSGQLDFVPAAVYPERQRVWVVGEGRGGLPTPGPGELPGFISAASLLPDYPFVR